MSLFSGITFTSAKARQLAAESAGSDSGGAASNSASAPKSASASATGGAGLASQPSKTSRTPVPKPAQTKAPASAPPDVLQFAPRVHKAKPAARPGLPATTVYSAAPVLSAAPSPLNPTGSTSVSTPVDADGDGKRAPAMTLAAADKGKTPAAAKRDADKKRKRKKKKRRQHVVHTFQPDEEYDPARPNDLGEYQHYRKMLREERQARWLEERRRRAAGEGDSDESSYYTDSSEDAPRRDAPRLFAPPKIYGEQRPPPPPPREPAPPPPPVAQTAATGDDAYARRVALSQAASGDDAYARRVAMSQAATGADAWAQRAAMSRPPEPAAPPPPPREHAPPPGLPPAPRGLPPAPPAGLPPRPPLGLPPPPSALPPRPQVASPGGFRPPPAHLLAGAPVLPGSGASPAPPPFRPPPLHLMAGAPQLPSPAGSGPSAPGSAYPPPTPQPPARPVAPPGVDQAEFERTLEEKKRAAEAIAAKLMAMSQPPPPSEEDMSLPFAERMMRKWGHKEGQGIGARGDGIKHALTAENISLQLKATDPKLSKRQLTKQRIAAANAKNRKWVQAPSSRGRIVNANEDERARAEQERFGEAGRVIVITGIVGSEDDVDVEISDDIGEECSKHGIVERVVLHMVEPSPADSADCLRVFVVFSGMAGAWRATKELDGRVFNGRKIRVRYFDEERFSSGDRDGDL